MRPAAPLDAIPTALAKTGFLLEHAVAESFRAAGWSVISNRYYVDDVDGRARELDLVAYRARKGADIEVVSTVLISCKKHAEFTLAFMSKDKPAFDPNMEWEPVHYWTDCQPLAAYLSSTEWKTHYLQANPQVHADVFATSRSVFAQQLVGPDGTKPQNDKVIFESITGLFKALDHELGALQERAKGRGRIYLFSMATIVDMPIVDVQYRGETAEAVEVERLTHLARFMVRKRELSALIHFVRSDKTSSFVESMSALADHNVAHMTSLVDTSYDAVVSKAAVRSYFAKKMAGQLKLMFNVVLRESELPDRVSEVSLGYENSTLLLQVDLDVATAEALDQDKLLLQRVGTVLADVARYKGKFAIEADVPF